VVASQDGLSSIELFIYLDSYLDDPELDDKKFLNSSDHTYRNLLVATMPWTDEED
jgi:hypothetical protein